jgi:hypothetical protein
MENASWSEHARLNPLPKVKLLCSERGPVQRGTPWTLFDNCEDLVSRAYIGQSGSSSRNFVVGLLAVAGACALAVGASKG